MNKINITFEDALAVTHQIHQIFECVLKVHFPWMSFFEMRMLLLIDHEKVVTIGDIKKMVVSKRFVNHQSQNKAAVKVAKILASLISHELIQLARAQFDHRHKEIVITNKGNQIIGQILELAKQNWGK